MTIDPEEQIRCVFDENSELILLIYLLLHKNLLIYLFLNKNLCCRCSLESTHNIVFMKEPILMSIHNIDFYEGLMKIIFQLSSNMHLISSSDDLYQPVSCHLEL